MPRADIGATRTAVRTGSFTMGAKMPTFGGWLATFIYDLIPDFAVF